MKKKMNEAGAISGSEINEQHLKDIDANHKAWTKSMILHMVKMLYPDVKIAWSDEEDEI